MTPDQHIRLRELLLEQHHLKRELEDIEGLILKIMVAANVEGVRLELAAMDKSNGQSNPLKDQATNENRNPEP